MSAKLRGPAVTTLTWVLVLLFFFPVFWMFLNAFKPEAKASTVNPVLFFQPVLDGFRTAMDRGMPNYLLNSITASVGSTFLVMLLAIPGAYALSVRKVKKVENSMFFFISTRFMPVAASILPLYMILKTIGGLDKVIVLVFVYAAMNLPIAIWMMRSFYMEVPFEVVEAARIDGARLPSELIRVVLPLVLPGISAAGLICFIFAWNEYFMALLLTSSAAKTTPPFLGSFVDGRGQFLAVLSAAATVAALPVITAGWTAQKQLVRGLSLGAVK
ncbi:MAG TPA: carbohydrate ABC transporter permease [Kineosporiaceae bacterium]